MNKYIFQHEFRSRVGSIITWSASVAALIILFFSIFASFADQAELLNDMMDKFPPELLTAFGMTGIDFSTVVGYYSLLFLFVQLCFAIQASNYGVGLVSIEESELTADFLLTKPVSRSEIFNSKLLAAIASLLLTNLAAWVSTFLAIEMFRAGREYDPGLLALLLGGAVLFQLFFLSVGVIISLLVKRVRSVTPYALGLSFGMYVLGAFSGLEGVSLLEFLTPFKHFDVNYAVQNQGYDIPLVLLNVAVTLAAGAASYWLYLRRDIHAVV